MLVGGRGGWALLTFTAGLPISNGAIGTIAGATTKVALVAWVGIVGGTAYGIALIAGVV